MGSDMVNDISQLTGTGTTASPWPLLQSRVAVIDTALTLGDRLEDCVGIAMHSYIYGNALKEDLITFVPSSQGTLMVPTYRGMAVVPWTIAFTPANGLLHHHPVRVTAQSATVHPLPTLDMGRKCIALPLPVTAVDRRHFIAA